jgi:CHAD domain-containing protein
MLHRVLAFEGSKRFRFRAFLALAAERGLRLRTVGLERQHTIAFDTADRRLEAIGASVRHRAFAGWTLSIPAQFHSLETRRPVERTFAGSPQEPPPALLGLLDAILCGAPLAAVGESRAILHRVRILGPNQNDAVAITALGATLELELLDPANAELFAGAARLIEEAGAKPAGDPASERLPKGATAAEAVARRLHDAFGEFCAAELRLRITHDAESLHDARVALRRVRACLRAFAHVFAPDWTEALLERIAALAGVYGRARDADVVVANVAAASERLGPHERAASVDILAPMLDARLRARRELTAFIGSPRHREIVSQARAAVEEPQFRVCAARPARKLVRKLVTRSWKRLERDVRALAEAPEDAALHAVRIRAKRCRYAAEVQIPVAGKRAHRFVRKLGELQDELGRIQDAALERKWLSQFPPDAGTATVVSALDALVSAEAEGAKLEWRRAWKAARRTRRALA